MRTAIDLVGPDYLPLHVHSSLDSSRLFSMFTIADIGIAASAQRHGWRSYHLRLCLICNESTELAQWPSDSTDSCSSRVRFHLMQGKYLQFFASAIIDMWVPIVIYAHHVQHLPNFVPRFLYFSHTRHCVGILKIAYLFDYASYEDVLCMNVDQYDVN